MSQSVHGHDLMALLAGEPVPYSQLKQLAEERFGADVCFHTCKQSGLSLEQLVSFLLERGKIEDNGEGLKLVPARMCKH